MDGQGSPESLVARFAQVVAEHPEWTAVVDEEGSLTYRELNAAANTLAAKIVPRRRTGGTYVVTMLPRTRHFIVASIAALKAGAAYVPVNPAYPDDRANDILGQTGAALFVTTSEIWKRRQGALKIDADAVLLADEMAVDPAAAEIDEGGPDRTALVLFTSGTTGHPKGVVHTQRSLVSISGAMPHAPGTVLAGLRYALIPDFGFIAGVMEIYECLLHGGECHIIGEETRLQMDRLAACLNDRRIDIAFMGSSLGVEMLRAYELGLKELWVGGEKVVGVPREKAERIRVINFYGLSEIAPITSHVVTGREDVIPAGRPEADCRLYVLDDELREVPQGTIGEVCASADRMADCYLLLPEASAERFVPNPFEPGRRLIRTGDRGYIDANGELMLCGRSDNMVKLRGLRIETGEIEVVAQTFPGAGTCACTVKPVNGADQLCLYYEGTADAEALRRYLVAKLTEYMVPARLIRLEKLPRNARGKIDRGWLPDPVSNCKAEMVPPASDNERMLLDLARRQIGYDKFGVTDDLFAFGLTSLGAMNLAVEAGKHKIRIKTSGLMAGKSVRGALQHDQDPIWWYGGYDPRKRDVVLFVHGAALTKNVDRKLQLWNERCNVLAIETTLEHYDRLYAGCDLAALMDRYLGLVANRMPAGATLRVCTGVSWGGKMAYLLAGRWRAKTGQAPTVVMGDTLLTVDRTLVAAILDGTLADWEKAHGIKFPDVFVQRLSLMVNVERTGAELPRYPGRTILLHALTAQFEGDNAALWKAVEPDIEIVPVEGIHEDIALDTDKAMSIWRKVAEGVLSE